MGLEKITMIRKNKGMTIEELSELSGVPLSTLKKISAGITTNPNLETVKAITHALGCKLDDLDDDIEKAPANPLELKGNDEKQLIIDYRDSSPDDKKLILRTAANAASVASEQPEAKYNTLKAAAEDWIESEALAANLQEDSQEAAQK